jgi:hypothetical protein
MALSADELVKLAGGKSLVDITPQDIDKMAVGKGLGFLLDTRIDYLKALKGEVSAGRLPLLDYLNIADPIGKQATETLNYLTTTGSKNATAANLRLADLRQFVDLDTTSGNGNYKNAKIPFSRTEIAKVPPSVLPTQDQLQQANIPLDWFPPGTRFPTTNPQSPQQNPGVNPVTGQPGAITQIPDPANPGKFITIPVVGDPLRDTVSKVPDQQTIEQEGLRQQEQQRQALAAQDALRTSKLTDLSKFLGSEEDRKFNLDAPGIYEDLNTRGLLRSSELGNALAREKSKLAGDSMATLTQQGISDRDASIQGISDILGKTQQFQSSGLERRFTLDDFQREADQARALGSQYAPQVKGGNSVLSGVLTGAVAGGGAGASLGPYGAGIGAVLGGTAGATKSGGK